MTADAVETSDPDEACVPSPCVKAASEALDRLRGELEMALRRRDGEGVTRLLRERASVLRRIREAIPDAAVRDAVLERARQETADWLNRAREIHGALRKTLDRAQKEKASRAALARAYQPPETPGRVVSTRA